MMLLLFVYVVFGPILPILITKMLFVCSRLGSLDVFLKSVIIVSTHRRRHVAN